MSDLLPGANSRSRGITITQVALRLVGSGDLADAIGDLTGLGRRRIEKLVAQAQSQLDSQQAEEFREVSVADTEWAADTLRRTYVRLASGDGTVLLRDALRGPSAIVAVVSDALDEDDQATLDLASSDTRSYFISLSHAIALLVTTWYRDDGNANRVAISAGLGYVLDSLTVALQKIDAIDERLNKDQTFDRIRDAHSLTRGTQTTPSHSETRSHPNPSLSSALLEAAMRVDRPPSAVYPATVIPSVVAGEMTLARVYIQDFGPDSDPEKLYTERSLLRGEVRAAHALRDARLAVVLGDPGTGKSTVLKAEYVRRIESGRQVALFARLATLAQILHGRSPASGRLAFEAVVAAFEDTVGVGLSLQEREYAWTAVTEAPDEVDLVLDGLDEVVDPLDRRNVFETLGLLEDLRVGLLVSSRIAGYERPLREATEFVVDRLSEAQRDSYFDLWFRGNESGHERIQAALGRSEELRDLTLIPVMATFAAYVGQDAEVPDSMPALYAAYAERYLRREWKEQDSRRTNHLEVLDLLDAASELAWAMATSPGPSLWHEYRWLDVAALEDILRTVPARREAVGSLVTTDGLLTPHGISAHAPLAQRYRWVHRTLHEHMVGRQLAIWLKQDWDAAFNFLMRAAQRPTSWLQPLQHAFGLLEPGLQERLFSALMRILLEGDPQNAIARTLSALMSQAAEEFRRKDERYRMSLEGRLVAEPNKERKQEILLEHVRSLANVDITSRWNFDRAIQLVTNRFVTPDKKLLDALAGLLLTRFPDSSRWNELITLLGRQDPDRAVTLIADSVSGPLRWNYFGGPFHREWIAFQVGRPTMRRILQRWTESADLLTGLPFITLLEHLDRGKAFLDEQQLDDEARTGRALARRYLDWGVTPSEDDQKLILPLLAGERGEVLQCVATVTISPPDWVLDRIPESGWLAIARRAEFFDRHPQVSPSSKGSSLPEDAILEVMRAFDFDDLQNAQRTLGLLEVLAGLAERSEISPPLVHELLLLEERLRGKAVVFEAWDRPTLAPHEMIRPIQSILRVAGWDKIWGALSFRWADADVAEARELINHARYWVENFGCECSADVFSWGVEHQVPTLEALPKPADASEVILEWLESGYEAYLGLDDNLAVLEEWLMQDGALPYWRAWLLEQHIGKTQSRFYPYAELEWWRN